MGPSPKEERRRPSFAAIVPGHKSARLTGCGDSTIRETTRVLEEQVIKRGIRRKY